MSGRLFTILRNLPGLLRPPIVDVIANRWRDRDRALPEIPDHHLYRPVYSPWLGEGEFGVLRDEVQRFSLVSPDRLWVLYTLARQALLLRGDFVECGVYKGGTARLLRRVVETHDVAGSGRRLLLFDTFAGMPGTDPSVDKHRPGDFADTSVETVRGNVGEAPFLHLQAGLLPHSLEGAGVERIALLHVDLDVRKSIVDTLEYCYPRLLPGASIVFDDYGFESCYGARLAVDEFFAGRAETPLVLGTGQAVMTRATG